MHRLMQASPAHLPCLPTPPPPTSHHHQPPYAAAAAASPVQASTNVTSVQLQTGESVEGAFIFLGESGSNNGMDNPVCAMVRRLPGWGGCRGSAGCLGVGAGRVRLLMCQTCVFGMLLHRPAQTQPSAPAQQLPPPCPPPSPRLLRRTSTCPPTPPALSAARAWAST